MAQRKKGTTTKAGQVTTTDGRLMDIQVHVLGKAQSPGSTATGSNIADPFVRSYSGDRILAPPYNLMVLAQMKDISPSLSQCIRAMVNNVHGFGWGLRRLEKYRKEKELPPEADQERRRVSMLLNYCNREEDFTSLRKKVGQDYESIGMACIEVVRNPLGEIGGLHWLPAHSVRMTVRDTDVTVVEHSVRDEDGNYVEVRRLERFRQYAQIIGGTKKVWFKEFGDPRTISAHTGKPVKGTGLLLANELLVFNLHSSYSDYGVPRWIADLMGILGSRKAESVNFLFFDNKTIPPLVVTISGGKLAEGAVDKLKDVFKQIKGVENFHDAIIIEAVPASVGDIPGEKDSNVRIDVKPLTQFMTKDAQFLDYQDRNDKSIGASFLLPPIYRGKSDDYNKATSVEAARVAEQQVFQPERRPFDYIINSTLMADMGIKYWEFYSLGAQTSDTAAMLRSVAGVKESVTVRTIQEMVAEMRGVPVAEIPEEIANLTLTELRRSFPAVESGEDDSTEKTLNRLMELRKAFQNRLDEDMDDGDSGVQT